MRKGPGQEICHLFADSDNFLPFCYSDNFAIAAHSVGVVSRITVATVESSDAEGRGEEIENIGATIVESLLLMDHTSLAQNMQPFKASWENVGHLSIILA